MATITRRYLLIGPFHTDLQATVHGSVVNQAIASVSVDIQLDDGVSGVRDALDEYMALRGFAFDQESPPTQTGVLVKSPNGSTWRIVVNDFGAVSAVAT